MAEKKKGPGRPRLELDERQIHELASFNCSLDEIAAVMNCDVKTLTSNYSQVIEKARGTGKQSLKRKQWEVAMSGNVTMLIWLGKIQLGQREQTEVVNTNETKLNPDDRNLLIDFAKKSEAFFEKGKK